MNRTITICDQAWQTGVYKMKEPQKSWKVD